jgi:hypothetical protein
VPATDHHVTRRTLYEAIWTDPMSLVAKHHGVSDVALAKLCHRAEIPIPPRGYWAKRAAGKSPPQPSLPPRGIGKRDELAPGKSRYYWERSHSDAEIVAMDVPPVPTFEETVDAVRERAQRLVGYVSRPRIVTHPAVLKLLEADEVRRDKQAKHSYTWDAPLFVSRIEQRRLRFINALFVALTRCGCKCSTCGKEARDLYFGVGDQNLSLRFENTDAEEVRYGMAVPPIPEGANLSLKHQHWKTPENLRLSWADTKEHKVEEDLTEVAVQVLVAGEWLYRSQLERHRNYIIERKREIEKELRQQQRAAERAERERLARIAKAKRDKLIADATAWREANDIRAFVAAVSPSPGTDPAWSKWALEEADRLDPTLGGFSSANCTESSEEDGLDDATDADVGSEAGTDLDEDLEDQAK